MKFYIYNYININYSKFKFLKSRILLFAGLIFFISSCEPDDGPRGSTGNLCFCSPKLANSAYDIDKDCINDEIERVQENINLYNYVVDFCDLDLSEAVDKYDDGSLKDGLMLPIGKILETDISGYPIGEGGVGYVTYHNADPMAEDHWGTHKLCNCIILAGDNWSDFGTPISVGDMSTQFGGKFIGHDSHQNGLDADIRYVRSDEKIQPLDIIKNPHDYDDYQTKLIMAEFIRIQSCDVRKIYVAYKNVGFTNEELALAVGYGTTVQNWMKPDTKDKSEHHHHYHLRIEK